MKKIEYNLSLSVSSGFLSNILHVVPYVMDLETIKKEVEYTNLDIENQIAIAHQKAIAILLQTNQLLQKKQMSINKINRINAKMNKTISRLINNLIDDTNHTAHKMVEFGKAYGYTVICELVMVTIGDRLVWIDPLRVAEF